MRDEKYEFFSDCREKKSTAQSAFKRRTHTGKGGRVRLPSDNLSKKELNKMNGETKSYRLNEPMRWKEFKAMPDDIKAMYIKLLREKFNAPDRRIAEMMDVHVTTLCNEIKRLDISRGAHTRGGSTSWDKEGFYTWCGLLPETKAQAEKAPEETPAEVPTEEQELTAEPETVEPETTEAPQEEARKVIPTHGNMIFDGLAEDVLETVKLLLSGANVHLHITWDTI